MQHKIRTRSTWLLALAALLIAAVACGPAPQGFTEEDVNATLTALAPTATPEEEEEEPTAEEPVEEDEPIDDVEADPTATQAPQPTNTPAPQPQPTNPPPANDGPTSLNELIALMQASLGGGGTPYSALEPYMTDEFTTCAYLGGCGLQTGDSRLQFVINQVPIGQDIEVAPGNMYFPQNANVNPQEVIPSRGWIANGDGEALLFYTVEDGIYKWSGGIWSQKSFAVVDYEYNLNNYMNRVIQAVIQRNWAEMQQLAPSDLKLLSISGSFFPDQYDDANSALAQTYLPPSANPGVISTTLNDPGNTYAAELGQSVFNCCGVNVVGAIKMSGWGANGGGQAILVIYESGPDVYNWYGFYYEDGGF